MQERTEIRKKGGERKGSQFGHRLTHLSILAYVPIHLEWII